MRFDGAQHRFGLVGFSGGFAVELTLQAFAVHLTTTVVATLLPIRFVSAPKLILHQCLIKHIRDLDKCAISLGNSKASERHVRGVRRLEIANPTLLI